MLTRLHHVQVAKPPSLAARGGVWFRSGGAEIHCGVEAGHPVEWDPHFPGHRRLYVADPVGYRLELLEPVPPD